MSKKLELKPQGLRPLLAKNSQIIILFTVLMISIIMTKGAFLRSSNLELIVASATIFGLLSLGQALVVISGGFDLSVGSLIAVAISGIATMEGLVGIFPGTIIAILIVVLLGAVNGVLVAFTAIPPFIVTLGMLSIAKSISLLLITGQQVRVQALKDIMLPAFDWLPFGSNSFPIVVIVLAVVAVGLLLHKTRYGRYLYAVGGNEKASIASGIPVKWVKVRVYALSGLMCGLGAVIYLFRNISATPGTGSEYLLYTFASTMIGGISMYGGSGNIGGTVIGIFCLSSISSVLLVAGVPPVLHKAVLGAIVLLVVMLQSWLKKSERG